MVCSNCNKSGHNIRTCPYVERKERKIGCGCCMGGSCSKRVIGGCMSCGGLSKKGSEKVFGGSIGDIIKAVKEYFLSLSKKGKEEFMKRANEYRRKFCKGKSRDLLYGELHPECQNFTGPGTRIDLDYVLNYPPYNDIDACSKQHDIDYMMASKEKDVNMRRQMIRDADLKVLLCYDQFPNEESYGLAKAGISAKIWIEDHYPKIAKTILPEMYYGGK